MTIQGSAWYVPDALLVLSLGQVSALTYAYLQRLIEFPAEVTFVHCSDPPGRNDLRTFPIYDQDLDPLLFSIVVLLLSSLDAILVFLTERNETEKPDKRRSGKKTSAPPLQPAWEKRFGQKNHKEYLSDINRTVVDIYNPYWLHWGDGCCAVLFYLFVQLWTSYIGQNNQPYHDKKYINKPDSVLTYMNQ